MSGGSDVFEGNKSLKVRMKIVSNCKQRQRNNIYIIFVKQYRVRFLINNITEDTSHVGTAKLQNHSTNCNCARDKNENNFALF